MMSRELQKYVNPIDLHESYLQPEPRPFPTKSDFNLRETQHTRGARPRNPKTPKLKELLHKLLVGGLGYLEDHPINN